MLALRSGGAVLDLLPEVGGAIARFAVGGIDILRPAPAGTHDVLQTGCFPLVPFANRIANGTFAFAGETIRLPRNFGDHPHALHGQGWQSAWTVRAQATGSAVLSFDHPAGDWPWDYAAEQAFSLEPDALRIDLTVINRSARAMPLSLGFHPYFPRSPQTVIRAEVAGVWLADATCIPTAPAGPAHFLALSSDASLAGAPFVDHCHFGWRGSAIIDQPGRTLHLSASPELAFLHLYVPQNAGFFCVEPVSAMPDAFNRNAPAALTGQRAIAPGDSLCATMSLAVRSRA
jgi:aldose 1-epimerase